jgi:hypothetical protein
MNVHVSQVRLKQWKIYSHPPSSICPFPISPSIIPPSTNPPSRLLSQFDDLNIKNSSAFRNNDRQEYDRMTGIWQTDKVEEGLNLKANYANVTRNKNILFFETSLRIRIWTCCQRHSARTYVLQTCMILPYVGLKVSSIFSQNYI